MRSFDQLRAIFCENVKGAQRIDYGSRESVRKANRCVDRYRKAAKQIGEQYPDRIPEFELLLSNDDPEISLCAAICLVELMPHNTQHEEFAKRVITKYMEHCDGAMRYGLGVWMEKHLTI